MLRRGYLDDDEASAVGVGLVEVDVGLVARDVEALDGGGALLELHGGGGSGADKGSETKRNCS